MKLKLLQNSQSRHLATSILALSLTLIIAIAAIASALSPAEATSAGQTILTQIPWEEHAYRGFDDAFTIERAEDTNPAYDPVNTKPSPDSHIQI